MIFPSTPDLWNQIAMILAWYWDDANDAGPSETVAALIVLNLVFPGDLPTSELNADEWWLLLDAIGSYRGAPEHSWNDELEAFYQVAHDNYWKLTLPDGKEPPEIITP